MAIHVVNEARRCLHCKKPMCREGCPISTNIPEAIELFRTGHKEEAGEMLYENNPLSVICSLVCDHEKQCEGHCVLGRKGAPVHFSSIENYISDAYLDHLEPEMEPKKGQRVAIIGSGPAGITISVLLARRGYDVTIFESREKIGGVLRYGIPEFRLPKSILDRYQKQLIKLGIGHDGHIGFNEPGEAFELGTHCVDLKPETIEANKRFFDGNEDLVPKQAYTMGIKTIMQARKVLMVVNGKGKAEIVKKAFFGPVTPEVPASILQMHPDFILVGDEEAFSLI